ncbi:MAG: hypothetical protein JEZ05_03525 [Tenericutes bacterium]|nr:hypothetical protein [Mycoplasmatota bacterium]
MGIEQIIIAVIILLPLGYLLKIKTNIKTFNLTSLGLFLIICLFAYIVTNNQMGGVSWPGYLVVVIYGIPVFLTFITLNLVEYVNTIRKNK